jgi:hypothetical protein
MLNEEFDYILEKIHNSNFHSYPFYHLEIDNFLSKDHFNTIINDNQIHFDKLSSDDELFDVLLKKHNYEIQQFPGCVDNLEEYKLKKHEQGITFRLKEYKNDVLKRLMQFMNSERFHKILREKFNIIDNTSIISAIQKNLSGYEISPHPDVRQKALTYLLNINKNENIENYDVHTHLLEMKEEYKYIENFWYNNLEYNRCWLPWDYCRTIKTINKNNTMLIFEPCSKPASLHAVKLNYDNLEFQRTQIYGNLMFENFKWCPMKNYEDIL